MTEDVASASSRLEGLEPWIESQLGVVPNFKGSRYLAEYVRLLGDDLDAIRCIVELGVAEGASLLAWSRLCPRAACVGVDREWPAALDSALERLGLQNRVSLLACDHNDAQRIAETVPNDLDLIVDDGSHLLEPTRKCFDALFEKLRPGGWYCIEDWGAGYWEDFGGPERGVHRLVHRLVDEIAIKDRMKPEAGRFREPARRPIPIDEIRVRGVEPIVFIRRKA